MKKKSAYIKVKNAQQNNLKNISIEIPLNKISVVTGLSGSGKSSLVFDVINAEGQRRYIETFSSYARQFLDRLNKPNVESIEGILPTVAIEQTNPVKTARSTVGTMTELSDYFKLLFSRVSELICYKCGNSVKRDDLNKVAKLIKQMEGEKIGITFTLQTHTLATSEIEDWLSMQGYTKFFKLGADQIQVITDRFKVSKQIPIDRIIEAVRNANKAGKGYFEIANVEEKKIIKKFSTNFTCSNCKIEFKEPRPALFSFNSPIGACELCKGFGRVIGLSRSLVIPNGNLSLEEGAIKPFQSSAYLSCHDDLIRHSKRRGVQLDLAWNKLTKIDQNWVFEGDEDWSGKWSKEWYGVNRFFSKLEKKAYKMHIRVFLSRYRSYDICPRCDGSRLKEEALDWKISGKSIDEWLCLSVDDALQEIQRLESIDYFKDISFGKQNAIDVITKEINTRLTYCKEVGLGYLTLDRQSKTLSGGEIQRINLTTALGSSLTNTLFILDEPSIGLHSRDISNLLKIIEKLKSSGNTVLIVEHDPKVISIADQIFEIGPGPGELGGKICFKGNFQSLLKSDTISGKYLSKDYRRNLSENKTNLVKKDWLKFEGISKNNLQNVKLEVPLNHITCFTGVSGSGKSTLAETIFACVNDELSGTDNSSNVVKQIYGAKNFSEVILIDQTPPGKTSRSNPVLYIGAFDVIRKIFAQSQESKRKGYSSSHYSFNSGNGRCPTCQGSGYEKIEMQFLSDIFIECESCKGTRYKPEILKIHYKNLSISDVLALTVNQALQFFLSEELIRHKLEIMVSVGLAYIKLGQPINTLSGGELQRLKIAGFLSKRKQRYKTNKLNYKSLFIFDEPTTGLHLADIQILISALRSLQEQGHTIIVVEHSVEFIQQSDWIIELGPEAGKNGGSVVAAGSPKQIAKTETHTGLALKNLKPFSSDNYQNKMSTNIATNADVSIEIINARENNLKNISARIPQNELTVITGVSGSGKSSLAFDIIFSEGQRRYLESLNAYARQFLQPAAKPDVDLISGIPPTVAIEQRVSRGGIKSTVGTLTEIHHFLRLLFLKLGNQKCPKCNISVEPKQKEIIIDEIFRKFHGKKIQIFVPLVIRRKGTYKELAKWASSRKFKYLKVNDILYEVNKFPNLDRYKEHCIELLIDELHISKNKEQLSQKINEAINLGKGHILIELANKKQVRSSKSQHKTALFSVYRSCPSCGVGFKELEPRNFSYNSKVGWCKGCLGTGLSPDGLREINSEPDILDFEEYTKQQSLSNNSFDAANTECILCNGNRLNEIANSVYLKESTITQLANLPVDALALWLNNYLNEISPKHYPIAKDLIEELMSRITFLINVGLGYLSLNRSAPSLSGGEAQRIRLASQLGSNLRGVCYVLDEPTIGLHPKDNFLLLDVLKKLKDKGNTIVMVEHDESAITAADHLIDIGPAAGKFGGEIVFQGKLSSLKQSKESITGIYLNKPNKQKLNSEEFYFSEDNFIEIIKANLNNLKSVNVKIPTKALTVVTGVSGSGKSTLIRDILYKNFIQKIHIRKTKKNSSSSTLFIGCKEVIGWDKFDRVLEVDQSPIGKTPRSTPATYIGIWDSIRKLFSETNEAKEKGWTSGHFSFNSGEGRCKICKGYGIEKIQMNFLPNVSIKCDACNGLRFDYQTRNIVWNGKSISDVLNMSFAEARIFFKNHSLIKRPIELLTELGLGYLTLGQTSATLSGGESQRIKLISELKKDNNHTKTLFILDEPTIGLHMADVENLLITIKKLVSTGNTVIVIEHNLEFWAAADWIIDLGPEGGSNGGHVINQNTPKNISSKKSHTGKYLKKFLSS
ncbi:MAG: excinuclease ABC subunit A [Betaproteobacteria bacterium TMED82]|nr:MAG: excinuclease ABC subunit A [Betaproteobacteria bacterium TMED82]